MGRRLLIGLVAGYVAVLLLAPIGALLVAAAAQGPRALAGALVEPEALAALGMSLQYAVASVVFHAVAGTGLAWVLVRQRFAGRGLLDAAVDLPFAFSPVVVGYVMLLLFGRDGWLAPLVERIGLRVAFAPAGVLIVTLFVTLPLMVREVMPVLAALGPEQEEAARTLGASGWQVFFRVTFPALRWGFVYGVILTLARALGEFGAVLVIGGGITGRTETATTYIFRALDERRYAAAYAMAIVLGALSLALVLGVEMVHHRIERRQRRRGP